jgi:DNA recombination protein RmuC
MEIYIAIGSLAVVFIAGVIYLARKLDSAQNKDELEKLREALYQVKELRENVRETRVETQTGLSKNAESIQRRLDKTIEMLSNQFDRMNKSVDSKLNDSSKILGERLDNASKVIGSLHQELGKMHELGPRIHELANIFQQPKLRGGMGEKILSEVLEARLPRDLWQTQYKFKSGSVVDAAIFTQKKKRIIPIDAKFPLDNFRKLIDSETEEQKTQARKDFEKDIKRQIDDIAKKYINPDERTTPFALMYLPSEDIYYEAAIRSESLNDYAVEKNVTIVSPNIFYHFLGIVLLSLQSQKIEEKAEEVLKMIGSVKSEATKFGKELGTLSGHISNSHKSIERVNSGFEKLSGKIDNVSDYSGELAIEEGEVNKQLD